MQFSPLSTVHICAGTLALLSGAVAMVFRKGSPRHVLAGRVFVGSMLVTAAAGVYLATIKHDSGSVGGGIFTFYLILTAWLTARRKDGETSRFDWIAALIPLSLGILTWTSGIEELRSPESPKDGDSASITLLVGSVMLLAVAGDVRMLVRGGVSGTKRVARHLWRMCFGLFIASGSFFLGGANRPLRLLHAVGLRQKLFEVVLRQETLLFFAILPLPLLIFWLIRVRFTRAYGGTSLTRGKTAG